MKKNAIVLFSLIIFLVTSCEETPVAPNGESYGIVKGTGLNGVWIDPVYENEQISYSRASEFHEGLAGIAFNANGEFKERANAGFCGTPPIHYSEYDGSWAMENDLVDVEVAFWGGMAINQWRIIEISQTKLVLEIISSDYGYDG